MKSFKAVLSIALCGILLFSACDKEEKQDEIVVSGNIDEDAFPASSCGVNLKNPVEKAVSLSPAITEIIAELGFSDRLVGISVYCDYPSGLGCETVGSSENPDIDAILELSPDAVFTLSALSERDVYTLNQNNIAVLVPIVPKNMEEYSAMYREVAAAFYGNTLAEGSLEIKQSAQIGKDARISLEESSESVQLGTFLYVTGKMTLAGNDTFESAVLSLCGENLCGESGYVSAEDFDGEAPQFLIVDSSLALEDIEDDETLGEFINDGAQVRFVTSERFERPTARTADVFDEISGGNARD